MCEGIIGGLDLNKFFPQPDSEQEKRERSDLLGENGCDSSQCETYMGIPFELESKLCLKR